MSLIQLKFVHTNVNTISFFFLLDNEYTLILGLVNEIELNVTVTNQEDSAYEAQLFVEHQPSVSYIAASKGAVICTRFNKTIVACTLGNPLKRDSSAHVTLRFDPKGLEDSAPKLSFKLFANSTSKQITPREMTKLYVNVVKKAELSIIGRALPEQSFYGGEVKGESAMEYLDDVGTPVEHVYQIYNAGPWRVPYLDVKILWPHQVANDKEQGKWLLYLEEAPIIEGGGEGSQCYIPPDSVNPLKLYNKPKMTGIFNSEAEYINTDLKKNNGSYNVVAESSEKMTASSLKSSGSHLNRVKRDRAVLIRAESLVDKDGKKTEIVNMVSLNVK